MKTQHIVWGLGAIVLITNVSSMGESVQVQQQQSSLSNDLDADRNQVRFEAREMRRDSRVALDLVRAGCLPVFDTATGLPSPMEIGQIVFRGPDLPLTISNGAVVCNEMGYIGVVETTSQGSQIVEYWQVQPTDMTEYLKWYEAIRTGNYESLEK